jgi:hypothetical protein
MLGALENANATSSRHPVTASMERHTSSAGCEVRSVNQPFRFLDLPPELRCIVYEHGTFNTQTYNIDFSECRHGHIAKPRYIQLVSQSLPFALLAICRLVGKESRPFLEPRLATLRDTKRFYIVVSFTYLMSLMTFRTGIFHIVNQRKDDIRLGMLIRSPPSLEISKQSYGPP